MKGFIVFVSDHYWRFVPPLLRVAALQNEHQKSIGEFPDLSTFAALVEDWLQCPCLGAPYRFLFECVLGLLLGFVEALKKGGVFLPEVKR